MRQVDTVVVGMGSVGSMALWHLARAGQGTVLGIEQFGPIHAEGAYTGESRLFRVASKEGSFYPPALLRARELWQQLEQDSQRTFFTKMGVVSIGPEGHPDLNATLDAIHEHGLPHETFDAAGLRARYPQFAVFDDDIGILDTLGGGVRPEVALLAATELAVSLGAEIDYYTQVTGIDPTSDGVIVSTSNGPVLAGKVIITSGPWTRQVVPQIADLLEVYNYALMWFVPRHIERFTPDVFPGFLRDLGDLHAFGVPTLDGFSIKVCPHIDLGPVFDPADRITTLTRDQLRWAGEQATKLIPDLVAEPARWSVHPDSQTFEHIPIIDTVESGRITIASGMSGNGFKFAPIYGLAAAELALTGESQWRHPSFRLNDHLERKAAREAEEAS